MPKTCAESSSAENNLANTVATDCCMTPATGQYDTTALLRSCRECKRDFIPTHHLQLICSKACRVGRLNRNKRENYAILPKDAATPSTHRRSQAIPCVRCVRLFYPRSSSQRYCNRRCVDLARYERTPHKPPLTPADIAAWEAKEAEYWQKFAGWLKRREPRDCPQSDVLERFGLPRDIVVASYVLRINVATLRSRIYRDPNNFLRPVRRYSHRPVTTPLNVPGTTI